MEVSRKKLQEALEIVKPGLSNKETFEQATAFAFMKGKVVTYNDEISVTHPVEGLESFEGAIQAEKLYPLLAKMKGDTVDISINEKKSGELIIKSGRIRAGMALHHEIRLPLEDEIKERGKWIELPSNFSEAVGFVYHAHSKDKFKPILNGIHINENGYVEASDGMRVARYKLTESDIFTCLVPASSLSPLIKMSPTHIASGKGWAHFKCEETVFSCRIFEDSFPNTTPHLKVSGTKVTLPKTINEALDRASVFAKKENPLQEEVLIIIDNNRLKLETEDETGWFKEEVNIKYSEDKIEFAITPILLAKILQETQTCIVGKDRLRFEGDNWEYMSLLRRR